MVSLLAHVLLLLLPLQHVLMQLKMVGTPRLLCGGAVVTLALPRRRGTGVEQQLCAFLAASAGSGEQRKILVLVGRRIGRRLGLQEPLDELGQASRCGSRERPLV